MLEAKFKRKHQVGPKDTPPPPPKLLRDAVPSPVVMDIDACVPDTVDC